jgi:NADPH:quinone reductase-like Zn-dependent oxidoreductase
VTALFWLASTNLRRQARKHHVSYRYMFMHPSGNDLTFMAQLADKQALDVITDRIFPFDQIADAYAYLEQGNAHGKVIVSKV